MNDENYEEGVLGPFEDITRHSYGSTEISRGNINENIR
jgi:hypothetical protein